MKKAKKFLVGLLAFASVSAFALGLTACSDDSTGDNTPLDEKNAIEQVYDSYVEYATAKGQTPLDYEVWLATIKGATGAQGPQGEQGAQGVGVASVEVDENGMLVITLTDGTVLPAIELPTGEPIEKGATRNLHYQKILGKEEYRVIGLGLASEQDIVISSTYNGLPVTEIGDNAFERETYITSVEIPDTVTTLGSGAFSNCDGLTSVTIGNSVTTIGDYAFCSCDSLTSVTIPDSVTTIGDSAFYYCDSLTSVTIGDSVTTIGDYAFVHCYSLTSVTIPDSVTTIGSGAFYGCDSLTSVTIPDSVTTIGDSAFSSCDSLTSVVFEDTFTWYYTYNKEDWQNKVNGTQVDVSDPARVADLLNDYGYYWYKL